MYGKNRLNNEINNIDGDKEKYINKYIQKYINIVNDKISSVKELSELINDLMGALM